MSKRAYNKIAEGLKEAVTMTVAAKRLEVLKAFLEAENTSKSPDQRYIDDLRTSIKVQEGLVKTVSPEGYRMVKI